MCQKMMKHSFFDNISKWIVAPNYDKYTDGMYYWIFYLFI